MSIGDKSITSRPHFERPEDITEDDSIEKTENAAEDSNKEQNTFRITNKVVQSNSLARAASEMSLVPLKIFKAAISCINVNSPPDQASNNTVYIKKSDILKIAGTANSHNYTYFKEQLFLLKQQCVCIYDPERKRTSILSPVRQVFWDEYSPMVGIQFEEKLMPQLIGLSRKFTQYNIANLIGVRSKFTINLYESLLSRTREYGLKTITISLTDLRLELGTTILNPINNKVKKVIYPSFSDLEKRAILPAIEEINKKVDFEFLISDYTKNKERTRAFVSITFTLRKRTSITDTVDRIMFPERLTERI